MKKHYLKKNQIIPKKKRYKNQDCILKYCPCNLKRKARPYRDLIAYATAHWDFLVDNKEHPQIKQIYEKSESPIKPIDFWNEFVDYNLKNKIDCSGTTNTDLTFERR